jgi:hypothetical protein
VRRLRAGTLAAREAAAAVALAVAAVAATGAVHRAHGAQGGVDLAILGTVVLLVVIVMSHRARAWIPAALLVFTIQGALLLRAGGLTAVTLSQVAAAGYIMATILIAFAALRPTLDTHAGIAAHRASLASRAAAEHAAADAIQRERQSTLAALEKEALPLLRGIAGGTLDPAARTVREDAARHAAALRHSLTSGRAKGELVTALEPALRAAAARELRVTVQLIGDPGTVPPPIARATLATVDAVLRALPPDPVTLTVLASGDDVEIYLTFGAPARGDELDLTGFALDLAPAVRWHAALCATPPDGGYLEVSWRKDGAA